MLQSRRCRWVLFCAALVARPAWAQVPYSGGTYTQNFDTLPGSSAGTYSGGSVNVAYAVPSQSDRNGMLTGSYTPMTGWYMGVSGSAFSVNFNVETTGTAVSPGLYSEAFNGVNTTADRALGIIGGTNMHATWIGMALRNDTANTINAFELSFRGEQYRKRSNLGTLVFSWSTAASFNSSNLFNNGTTVSSLDFTSPQTSAPLSPSAPLDGNASENSSTQQAFITGANWAPGSYLWLRWVMGGGSTPTLAVDDLDFTGYLGTDRFYVGGHGGLWSVASNWDTIEGGAGSAGVPDSGDNVYVRASTNKTVNYDGNYSGAFGLNRLTIDSSAGASVALTQSLGSMLAVDQLVAVNGNGTYAQAGGTNTAQAVIRIGGNAGSSGGYALSGSGELTTPQLVVGSAGSGSFVQTGGTLNITSNDIGSGLQIAAVPGSTGSAAFLGGTVNGFSVQVGGTEYGGAGGTGTLTVNGGSATFLGNLHFLGNASSQINLNSGFLRATNIDMGGFPERFNWTGGTLQTGGLTAAPDGTIGNVSVDFFKSLIVDHGLFVGSTTAMSGSLSQTGGSVSARFAQVQIGGLYSLSGGTFTATESLTIFGAGTTATITQTGGTITTPVLSVYPDGVFNYNGGTLAETNLDMRGGVVSMSQSGNRVMVLSALSFTGSGSPEGKLNLRDNKLIVRNGVLGTVSGGIYNGISFLIQSGRNGGAWDGTGIFTSMPDAQPGTALTALGIAKAGDLGISTFAGQSVNPADVVIAYTFAGDANLSGNVDADDYFQIDSNYNKPAGSLGFFKGDFNYDGVIDGDDYQLIDGSFSASLAASHSGGVTAVPEPTSAASLATLALAAGTLRRRRHDGRSAS